MKNPLLKKSTRRNFLKDTTRLSLTAGLPSIFLTITPDDLRSFRVVLYSLAGKELDFGNIDVNSLSNEDIMMDFKVRQETRIDFPGLCSWDYQRIMQLVIKHIFGWDEENQKSTGIGLFGELEAWTLATEEQGRKSLHGHFLLAETGSKQSCLVNQVGQVSSGESGSRASKN